MGGETEDSTVGGGSPLPDGGASRHLIIFNSSSSAVFQLPAHGEVVIGRSSAVELHLEDVGVSRRHALLRCSDAGVELLDLDSHNGTFLNGQRLGGTRALHSGDAIAVGSALLVFYTRARPPARRPILEDERWRERLDEELERSLRYGRPFTLVVARLPSGAEVDGVRRAWAEGLRGIDVGGAAGADQLIALLPEVDEDSAADAASRLQEAIAAHAAGAQLGYAVCPGDGCDAAALLAAAHSAAAAAYPGSPTAAAQAFQTRTLGEHTLVIADPAMQRLYALIDRLAASELPVLICGETGCGKELAAAALHLGSGRAGRMVTLNCASLPENLVESELFGYEKGAFTGAALAKPGLVETAAGGTLFLDEVGEMPPAVQAKLLRVIETRRVTRLGTVVEQEVDVRVIAATHRNLADDVKAGRFRQDLFFRLGAATLWIPPLRDRKREVGVLAQHFLAAACARAARTMAISDDAMRRLARHPWPGNVRELKNVMAYVAAAVHEPVLEPWHLADSLGGAAKNDAGGAAPPAPEEAFRPVEDELRDLERTRMSQALARAGGNQTQAAALIGMPLRTFQAKLKHYGLSRPAPRRK
jgi:DNA-binding NtrC family response regulator